MTGAGAQPRSFLVVAGFLIPVIVLCSPRLTVVLAIALASWAMVSLVRGGQDRRDLWKHVGSRLATVLPRGVAAPLAGLVGLGLVSSLWSLAPAASLDTAAQIAGCVLVAMILCAGAASLDPARRGELGTGLAAGVAAALALASLAKIFSADLYLVLGGAASAANWRDYFLDRQFSFLLLVLFPALAFAGRRRIVASGLLLLAALVILSAANMATRIALLAGLAVLPIAYGLPRLAPRLAAVLVAGAVLAAPVAVSLAPDVASIDAPLGSPAASSAHRFVIWRFAQEKIAARPVAGWGLDAARRVPGGRDEFAPGINYLPLHPHSAPLQLWLELGGLGAATAAAFAASLAWAAGRIENRLHRALALAQLAAAFVVAGLSYGIWQNWWMAALAMGGGAATLAFHRPRSGAEP